MMSSASIASYIVELVVLEVVVWTEYKRYVYLPWNDSQFSQIDALLSFGPSLITRALWMTCVWPPRQNTIVDWLQIGWITFRSFVVYLVAFAFAGKLVF
jgi:hypothetical protein